jgi:hypothetical protein
MGQLQLEGHLAEFLQLFKVTCININHAKTPLQKYPTGVEEQIKW